MTQLDLSPALDSTHLAPVHTVSLGKRGTESKVELLMEESKGSKAEGLGEKQQEMIHASPCSVHP